MSAPAGSKRRRAADAPRAEAELESHDEDDAPAATPGLFARAFEAVMKREIAPEKGTAVLAKRKTVVQKQLDKERVEAKAAAELRKQRKAARVAQLVVPAPDAQGYERQLKKVATKGVVALFNAINKHQRSVVAATSSEAAPARKPKRPAAPAEPLPRVSLLDMFQKRPPQAGGGGDGTAAAAAAPPPSWSVLADDFVRFDGGGDGGQAAAADDLLDDDEDDG